VTPITPVDPVLREVTSALPHAPVVPGLAPHALQPQDAEQASLRAARARTTWESAWDAWNGSRGIKGGVFALSVIVMLSITGTAEMIPPHALVVVDPVARTYNAPACALGHPVAGTRVQTKGEAETQGYKPDAECWSNGGFLGGGGSRWMDILRRMKLYPAKQSRWRIDGSWRW
jgi:hypothetical protein